ncbi:MAG: LPS translocon maturation chaperone LptM [Methylocystis sp.]
MPGDLANAGFEPVTLRRTRSFILLAAIAAASLSACGRRGPLELPPEVQARGEALKAEQAAALAKNAPKPAPGQPTPEPPPPPIPGTIGNRPPAQYPFPLDPLL